MPIQPRLFEILSEAKSERVGNGQAVVPMSSNNRRRNFLVIINRAGLSEWPSPFHALRKSLTSDWLSEYPVMDVCK